MRQRSEPAEVLCSERVGRDRREIGGLAPLRPVLAAGKSETCPEQALLLRAGAEDVLASRPPGGHACVTVRKRQFEESTLSR